MKILSVAEDNVYNLWQLEVQAYNMKKMGYEENFAAIICGRGDSFSSKAEKFVKKIPNVFYFKMPEGFYDRSDYYAPAIQQYGLAKYLELYPTKEPFLMLDVDTIFQNPLDLSVFHKDIVYTCPTSYSRVDYYASRGPEYYQAYQMMAGIVGISLEEVKAFEARYQARNSPSGHTFILPPVPYNFFQKAFEDSLKIYDAFTELPEHVSKDMRWMSSLWSHYYNILLLNKPVVPTVLLDFCWATDDVSCNKTFIHMAGAMKDNKENIFSKLNYTSRSPLYKKNRATLEATSKEHAAWKYVQWMLDYMDKEK